MRRLPLTPRPDWATAVGRLGLGFHTLPDGRPYWHEAACYEFTAAEVDTLERATDELMDRCLEAGDWVVRHRRWDFYPGLRPEWIALIEASWEADEGQLLGRFDLAFDGHGPPKLLEFNADTPTSLLEASVVQWYWLEDCCPGFDQFNSLHERLVARWRELFPRPGTPLHGACLRDAPEDEATVRYLLDTALQAGLTVDFLPIEDLGASADGRFLDGANRPVANLFKLYPWEWLLADAYGSLVPRSGTRFLEPAWKLLFSHKGLLAVLWERFPGHPNLLPAALHDPARRLPAGLPGVVRKPVLGREGRNVTILSADGRTTLAQGPGGPYGAEGFVFQALGPVPSCDGHRPVLGSWVVGGRAAGLGLRESDGPITDDGSRFVPHRFRPASG